MTRLMPYLAQKKQDSGNDKQAAVRQERAVKRALKQAEKLVSAPVTKNDAQEFLIAPANLPRRIQTNISPSMCATLKSKSDSSRALLTVAGKALEKAAFTLISTPRRCVIPSRPVL